jgi:hypothetical protein
MLPTGRGPSDYPASAGVGDCIAVIRRFEEKAVSNRGGAEFAESKKPISDFLLCVLCASAVQFEFGFSPSEELPTTGHGLTPISSRQRLEHAERDYARTGPLPFPRRLRQRVAPG